MRLFTPHIYLVDLNLNMINAWKEFCGDMDDVTIIHGSILENPSWDAFVSPANSFGFMNGGVDLAYSEHYGWDLQKNLQELIAEEHYGELMVGDCISVPTKNDEVPFMFSAPTMRTPVILPKDTLNPYLATRAVLICHQQMFDKSKVKGIAFPGMGTGVGRVEPRLCAKQMKLAIENIREGVEPFKFLRDACIDQHENLTRIPAFDVEFEFDFE